MMGPKQEAHVINYKKKCLRNPFLPFGLVALFAVLIMITVGFSLRGIAHSILESEAERKAELWAQKFMAQAPAVRLLADNGDISPAQLEKITTSIGIGDIFRFNFFSTTGEVRYVSDDATFPASGEPIHDVAAQSVYASRQSDISVKYGGNVSNRPDTFVEAYIPAILPTGETLGVMEIYVDVSSLAATLDGVVMSLGALVIFGSALAFLVPSLILVSHNQKLYSAQTRETWLAAILNHAPFEVVIKDADGKIRAISQNVIDEMKLSAEDFIGKTTADFLPEDISQQYMDADREVVRTGEATQKEVVETINGVTRYSLSSKFPLMGYDGKILGVCSITNDITDLRLSETKLAQAQKMETVGQLSGGIAHDFNNLLAVILGNLELIEEADVSEEIQDYLTAAKSATHRGAGLTKSLLSFARQSRLEPAVIDINQMVRETKNWTLRVIPETIDVEISLLAGLWRAEADPSLTQNALLNLILNARDAMPLGGKTTIETSNVCIDDEHNVLRGEDIEAGRYVMLAISDTGEGISKENIVRIFDPFFTTKPVGMGSGLGLSMVQGFLKQSGGTVRVYSEEGVGTTFKLYFKAVCGKHDEPSHEEDKTQEASEINARILIVEDEEAVLDVIKTTLKKAGYQITSAQSGDEALRMWDDDRHFDLLVTDIVMPGELQGTHLARALRERDPRLPVVFMSGYASEATVHEIGLRPEDIRLMKPVLRLDLLAAVEKALRPRT